MDIEDAIDAPVHQDLPLFFLQGFSKKRYTKTDVKTLELASWNNVRN